MLNEATALLRHLASRGCDPALYACHLDHVTQQVTFMLFSPATGKIVGYQKYNHRGPKTCDGKGFHAQDLRYFTHVSDGELAVFGTETLNRPGPVYLVEGVFDAIKLHSVGLACLAALGNGAISKRGKGSPLENQLRAMNRKVIGVLDNDVAGKTLANLCDEVFVCTAKDPGDMSQDEVRELLGVD